MDLASPLSALSPSLEGSVLEVLARTESWLSATQISRLARRGTRAGLTLALDRLVHQGLVIAEPANRGHLYRFNRSHLLARTVEQALDTRRTLVSKLRHHAAGLPDHVEHVSLFGSFARNEAGAESDIDAFVLLRPPSAQDPDFEDRWREVVSAWEDAVLAWTGNRLEVLSLTVEELSAAIRSNEPLIASLLEESIPLRGEPFVHHVTRATNGRTVS